MSIRFHLDPDTGEPHVYQHGVREDEVREALDKPLEEIRGRDDSVVAIGRTRAGRYLRVIYVPDDDSQGIFVVTAYNLPAKQLRALRRRMRKRSS